MIIRKRIKNRKKVGAADKFVNLAIYIDYYFNSYFYNIFMGNCGNSSNDDFKRSKRRGPNTDDRKVIPPPPGMEFN